MSKVVLDVSMSLDGFIAGPNGREAEPRRIPPRKSGPPRRSRGTPIRIQRRASRSRNCPRRLRTRTSRAASSLDTSDLTRVRQERSGSGDRCTSRQGGAEGDWVRYWKSPYLASYWKHRTKLSGWVFGTISATGSSMRR